MSALSQSFAGKVAFVTGAASGIGKATAQLLAQHGASIALADINEPAVRKVADEIAAGGTRTLACKLDVSRENDWAGAIASVLSAWNRLDVLVNNAGIAMSGAIYELSLDQWQRVMSINLNGTFLGIREAMRAMKAAGGGTIVNVASAAGIKALPNNSAYGTSKAAIRFMTKIAALEGAPHKIRVNSISPGGVATPMWEGTPLWPGEIAEKDGHEAALRELSQKGFAQPVEIARAILFLASDDAKSINGVDLPVDDAFSA